MTNLKEKYDGRKLTGDQAAVASNEIAEAIRELEAIDFTTGGDYILLKWGTLKGWELSSERGKALTEEYMSLGRSMGGMGQKDSDRQREIILEMIDECDGTIQSDWSGEYLTKAEAKKYVSEYSS